MILLELSILENDVWQHPISSCNFRFRARSQKIKTIGSYPVTLNLYEKGTDPVKDVSRPSNGKLTENEAPNDHPV